MESIRKRDDLENEATRWIVRLDCTRAPEVVAQHEAWLAANARHQVAFSRAKIAWTRSDILRRLAPIDRMAADPDLLKKKKRTWFEKKWMLGAGVMNLSMLSTLMPKTVVGAMVMGLAAIVALVAMSPAELVHATRIGEQQHVVLDDGSVVDLNTDTEIRVRFTAGKRDITLIHGEAMFNVAHDASRPFEVTANGVTARAVGTKFSMRVYDDQRVETIVTEGRVLVLRQTSVLGVPTGAKPIGHTLTAGEMVVVDGRTAKFSRVSAAKLARLTRWTTGTIAFEGEALADVVAELNRYVRRRLEILDRRTGMTKIGGVYDAQNAPMYAEQLVKYFGADKLRPVSAAREAREDTK